MKFENVYFITGTAYAGKSTMVHLVRLLLPHTARLMAGVFLQSVVLHRVIEDRNQLVLYRPQVSLRIRLSICIPILGQRVLPLTDIRTTLQNAY